MQAVFTSIVEVFVIIDTLIWNNNNSILDIPPVPKADTTVCNNNCKSINDIPPFLIVDITVCKYNSKSTQDIPPVPVVNTTLCNSSNSSIQPLPDNFSSHQIPVTLNSLSNCFSNFNTQTIPFQFSGWIVDTILTQKILMMMMIRFSEMVDLLENVEFPLLLRLMGQRLVSFSLKLGMRWLFSRITSYCCCILLSLLSVSLF